MNHKENKIVVSQFNDIFESHKEAIFSFCLARSRCNVEMSEDCTQEAFIVLYKRMKNGEKFENPKAFLYRTANNFLLKALDKKTKKSNRETSIEEETLETVEDRGSEIDSGINYKELTERIDKILNDEEKRLFELRFIEDMKIADISRLLDYNNATCATKIHRLRNKLKTELADYIVKGEK